MNISIDRFIVYTWILGILIKHFELCYLSIACKRTKLLTTISCFPAEWLFRSTGILLLWYLFNGWASRMFISIKVHGPLVFMTMYNYFFGVICVFSLGCCYWWWFSYMFWTKFRLIQTFFSSLTDCNLTNTN